MSDDSERRNRRRMNPKPYTERQQKALIEWLERDGCECGLSCLWCPINSFCSQQSAWDARFVATIRALRKRAEKAEAALEVEQKVSAAAFEILRGVRPGDDPLDAEGQIRAAIAADAAARGATEEEA